MTEPVKDRQTVTPEGADIQRLPDGMSIREAVLHTDFRGEVIEVYDPRWGWHPDPLVFSYIFTVRPGIVKGWGMHEQHEDRYFLIRGEVELVLYDPRPDSSTCGEVIKVYLTERRPRLVNIPIGVWHADRNIGTEDAIVINFPTIQYDHSAPDKYRLPLENDVIPYSFGDAAGG